MSAFLSNPARRYKNFHPRQALLGSRATGTPVNNATVELYNNSLGPVYLIVRDFTIIMAANQQIRFNYTQGNIIAAGGTVQQMIPTDAVMAGLIGSLDTATNFGQMYSVTAASGQFFWQHEIPFAIIPPGFGLMVQGITAAQAMTASYVWEAIFAEELDFLYGAIDT